MATAARYSLELENRIIQDHYNDRPAEEIVPNQHSHGHQSLEPADGGSSAWKVLIGAFVFEAILWGFPLSFGVFQNYYSQLPEFSNDPYLPIVGSMATGIAFLGGPFMIPLVKRFPSYHMLMILIGWPLCILGLIAGSFATTIPTLIVTQGIMYGVGFVTFYYPIISMVNEWWVTRRGLAWGIIASASGASGVVMPFIVEAMLNKYGYKTTLRAIAVALVLLTGPLLPLFKGRLPPTESSIVAKADWSFLKKPIFWIYSISNLAQGLGFFFPSLYLPSYATSIGLGARQGALVLAVMNVAQMLGQFTFGILSDGRVSVNVLILISTLVTAVASLTIWGFARSLGPLISFALIYGFFGYGYVSLRVHMGTAVTSDPTAALATFSIFCFGQGVGNVLAGPISAVLLSRIVAIGDYGAVRYKSVVIFTGCTMIISAMSVVSWYIRPKRLRT